MPETVRRGRNTEEGRRKGAIEVGRSRANREITARHSPDATSIPAPSQVGQGSIPSIETRTGRLRRARTRTKTMTRARDINGSVPARPDPGDGTRAWPDSRRMTQVPRPEDTKS
jgi:hypothetical protein